MSIADYLAAATTTHREAGEATSAFYKASGERPEIVTSSGLLFQVRAVRAEMQVDTLLFQLVMVDDRGNCHRISLDDAVTLAAWLSVEVPAEFGAAIKRLFANQPHAVPNPGGPS